MAKHKYAFDEKKLARFLKEGRGKGHGPQYKPWLTIQDVSSSGRSTRILGATTGRVHHFLSDLETRLFLMLDWSDRVTDIREQYPLDRQVTRMLAAAMGITHPRDTNTQTDIVMTTDLLVDVRHDGAQESIAFSVKPADRLDDRRTLEKLELERRYWEREEVAWYLTTERELPRVRTANLRWLHEMRSLAELRVPHPAYWEDRCARFLAELSRARGGLIGDFIEHLEQRCAFGRGEAMTALRHLAATRRISLDLDREFSHKDPLAVIGIAGDGGADAGQGRAQA